MEKEKTNKFGVKVSTVLECLKNTKLCNKTVFVSKYPDDYKAIENFMFPVGFTFPQKMYHVLQNDFEFKLCKTCNVCGEPCKFRTINTGYSEYCSRKCSSIANGEKISKSLKAKTKDEWNVIIKKRVNAYHSHTDEEKRNFFEKRKQTNKERHGKENYTNVDKLRETLFKKTEEEKEQKKKKTQETWKHKTKAEIDDITRRAVKTREATCFKKYGVKNIMQTSIGKDAFKKTLKDKTLEQKTETKRKMVYSARKSSKANDINFIGYYDNGLILCRCTDKDCNACKDGLFYISEEEYIERTSKKQTICTIINPCLTNKELYAKTENEKQWMVKCTNKNCNKCVQKFYKTNPNIYRDRIRYGYEPCTILNPVGNQESGKENCLCEYIKSVYDGNVETHNRSVLNGKELDIYLPEKKLAFEFNGVYWHSDLFLGNEYHYNKSISCLNKGVQLIHIWEDDWLSKQDILKNLIRGKLGLHTNKLNARDCVVKEIDTKTAKKFCETYHIQGYTSSQVKLGLYKDNQLAMVCLFTHKRRLIGGKPKDGEWELSRMCSPFDTHVRGGASKLLKHFVKLYNPKSIVTFADLSVSNGGVYEKMGFKKVHIVPPTYYWVVDGVRLPRYRFQKSNLVECIEHPELTEREVMELRGSFRCWDAGKIKYVVIF